MKLAIIGSRSLKIEKLEQYIPMEADEIVSGGAKGVDSAAAKIAKEMGLRLTEFLPQYERYGRAAPLKRNEQIAAYADEALVFWDGVSRGTRYTMKCFENQGKRITLIDVKLQ